MGDADVPLVLAAEIGRRFGAGLTTTDALSGASCAVYTGERLALTGSSGSGKSTLLQILGGLDSPTSGRITWPGLGPRATLRPTKIMYIPQGPSLLPPLTVLENVRFPLLLAGLSERDATTDALTALAAFGVAHLAAKLPEEISGGQAQRIAIARAVAVRPRLLLADEPTGQLDSVTAMEVLATLLGLVADQGTALVLSTHDPRVAVRFGTIWTMRDGLLRTASAPAEPAAPATAADLALPTR